MTSWRGPMPTERVLADFLGRWRITREIVPATGPRASFEGHADWRAVPGGADYVETGVLRLAGAAPMTAASSILARRAVMASPRRKWWWLPS